HLPRHPLLLARFGWRALRSARGLGTALFEGPRARGLFAGLAAHSMLPLDYVFTAAFGILLGFLGHAAGWPVAAGGAQRFSDALAGYLRSLGGEIVTRHRVASLQQLPRSRVVLLDITPKQFLHIAGDRLPVGYRGRFEKYRYGPGVFKMDWALSEPIPWKAAGCARAATVHLGGSLEEIAAGELAVTRGELPEKPFV